MTLKIKTNLFIILLIILPETVWSQDSTAIYRYRADEFHKIIDLNGLWQIRKQDQKQWTTMKVPGVLNKPGNYLFKRTFPLDSTAAYFQHRIVAEGINYEASFTFNNTYAGSHRGGYSSFELNLEPNILRFTGENEILLEIKTAPSANSTIPLRYWPQGPANKGGVHRSIYILSRPLIRIERWQTRAHFNDANDLDRIDVIAELQSDVSFLKDQMAEFNWQVEIYDPHVLRPMVVSTFEPAQLLSQGTIRDTVTIAVSKFELWSPKYPKLYDIKIRLYKNYQLIDEINQKIGFRDLEISDNQFLLNGKKLFLMCIDWVEDFPEVSTAEDSLYYSQREDLVRIKSVGANAVRVHFHPPHPNIPALCNELGLLLLMEVPINYIPTTILADQKLKKDALNYWRELITRDRHHPCVLAWGLGSGFDLTHTDTDPLLNDLHQTARELDDRPIYVELDKKSVQKNLPWIDFYLVNLNDISSWQLADNIRNNVQLSRARPSVVTFGVPFLPGASFWAESQRAEDAQAFQIEEVLLSLKKMEQLAGISIFSYADWLGGAPWLNFGFSKKDSTQFYGLLDRARKPRVSYSVVKAFFTGKEPIRVSPVKTNDEYPIVYPITGILFVLIFILVYRRARPLRDNFSRIFIHPHGFYMDLRDNRRVSFAHTLLLALAMSIAISLTVSSLMLNYRNFPITGYLFDYFIDRNLIKEQVIWLAWQPEWNILASVLVTLFFIILASLVLRIVAVILRRHFSVRQGFVVISWVGACWVFALPLATILVRLFYEGHLSVPAIGLLIFFIIWFWIRLFKAIRVVLILRLGQTILLALVLVLVFVGLYVTYLQYTITLFDYLPYFYATMFCG